MQYSHSTTRRLVIVKYLFLLTGVMILTTIFLILVTNYQAPMTSTNEPPSASHAVTPPTGQDYDFKIDQPIFEGFSRDALPYKIISKAVFKSKDDLYNLLSIDGSYNLSDGILKIKAHQGKLDHRLKLMNLQDDVEINYHDITVSSKAIELDIGQQNIKSDDEVQIKYKNSIIRANKFSTQSTDVINLEGNVEAYFQISNFK